MRRLRKVAGVSAAAEDVMMFEAGSPKSRALELHRNLGGQFRHIEHDIAQIAAEIRAAEARGIEWSADFVRERGQVETSQLLVTRANELKGSDVDNRSV